MVRSGKRRARRRGRQRRAQAVGLTGRAGNDDAAPGEAGRHAADPQAGEDFVGAVGAQVFGQRKAEGFRLVDGATALGAGDARTIRQGDEAAQPQLAVLHFGVGAQGTSQLPASAREVAALGAHAGGGVGVGEQGDPGGDFGPVGQRLDAQRPGRRPAGRRRTAACRGCGWRGRGGGRRRRG